MELESVRELFEQVTMLEVGKTINLEGKVVLIEQILGRGEQWKIEGPYSLQRSDEKTYEILSHVPQSRLRFALESRMKPISVAGMPPTPVINAYVTVLESEPQVSLLNREGTTALQIYPT